MQEQNQLDRIEKKIDKLDARQNRMEITQVAQHLTLEEHTRRSTLLEEIVLPIQRKVTLFEGGLKILGALTAILGVVVGLGELILRAFHL